MASKYAVASGSWSSTSVWSDSDSGPPGATVPADGDSVTISAAVNVLMDVDQSSFTGLLNVVIRGGVTPGSLYWANGTSGYLKVRTGYSISGTLDTNKGRLIANADGTWATTTALQFSSKAVILLEATAVLTATNLDINFRCTEPTNKYVRTYGVKVTTTVDAGTDTFTAASHGYAANTKVMVKSSGTVPSPLYENIVYYVVNTTTDTFKLSYTSSGSAIDLTDAGSGTIEVYSGHPSGSATVNVLTDITSDPYWTSASGFNTLQLVSQNADVERNTFVSATATTITVGTNVNSLQLPGAMLFLDTRNVQIKTTCASSTQDLIVGSVNNYLGCGITNTTANRYGEAIAVNCTGNTLALASWVYSGIGTSATNNTADIIVNCAVAVYNNCTNNIINLIAGATSDGLYATATQCTVTKIFGCLNGISGPQRCRIETIDFCGVGIDGGSGAQNVVQNINNCLTAIEAESDLLITGTMLGNGTQFSYNPAAYSVRYNYIKNIISDRFTTTARNSTTLGRAVYFFEKYNRVSGADAVYTPWSDIVRTPCNGTGNAPSVDPDSGNGDCVGITTYSAVTTCIDFGIIKHRIWLSAGTYTITYKVQSMFTSLNSEFPLYVGYITTGGANATVSDTSSITTRASTTDWTQTRSVNFTSAVDGWVDIQMDISAYESGKNIYVWPTPTVT